MRSHKKVQEFLEEVNEQIRYRPMCAVIDEELVAHIEDKAELYKEYGIQEEDAVSRAVRDMGDAMEIGLQMNATHHTRIKWPLLGLTLFFVLLGVLENLRWSMWGSWDLMAFVEGLVDSSYYLVGLLAMAVMVWQGYPFIIRHVKKICIGYLVLGVTVLITSRLTGQFYEELSTLIPNYAGFRISHTVFFGVLLLSAPVMAVFAYRQRHAGRKGLCLTAGFVAVLFLMQSAFSYGTYLYMAILAVLLTFLVTLLYMNHRDYLSLPQKQGYILTVLLFVVLIGCWGLSQSTGRNKDEAGKTQLSRTMELFLTPERQAATTWEDGYNAVIIKELLSRAELIGPVELTEQELYDYATGAWYYGEGKEAVWAEDHFLSFEENKEYLDQFISLETVTLEDTLPQHYHNNYRIAYWILKYGWIPGLLLLGSIAAFGILLIRVSIRIRNRLGRLVAFAGSICLLIQYLFYILGNFGHQFAWFGNLPFLSEGIVSITVNGILLGLVLSAYRYDLVMEEKLEN